MRKYPTLENNFLSVHPHFYCVFVRLSVRHIFDPPTYVRLSIHPFVTFSILAKKSMHSMLILQSLYNPYTSTPTYFSFSPPFFLLLLFSSINTKGHMWSMVKPMFHNIPLLILHNLNLLEILLAVKYSIYIIQPFLALIYYKAFFKKFKILFYDREKDKEVTFVRP